MSAESESLLLHDVVPRLRSAIRIAVAHVGSEDDAELLPAVGGTPAAAPETGALPIFKPPPGSLRSIVAGSWGRALLRRRPILLYNGGGYCTTEVEQAVTAAVRTDALPWLQASLRDAHFPGLGGPWIEIHGYPHRLAPRGAFRVGFFQNSARTVFRRTKQRQMTWRRTRSSSKNLCPSCWS